MIDNSDKGLTVPKWVLKNQSKVPKMPKNLSAQIVCPCPKVWDFDKKKASLGVLSPYVCLSIEYGSDKTFWTFRRNMND